MTEREKEIARIISEELNDPHIPWAAIDAAAKRIVATENTPQSPPVPQP